VSEERRAIPQADRRVVTILFGDIKGSTQLAEALDPEEVTEVMNRCFERLSAVIYQHGGVVDKYIGDCVMALFGAPVAHENDAELAIRAGLSMQQTMQDINAELGPQIGKVLAMRIGINTGLVVAGAVGSDQKRDYTVMGHAVDVAKRIEEAGKVGAVVIGEETHRQVEGLFEFEKLEGKPLKGVSEGVDLYEVAGVKAERGSLKGIKGLAESPFIGRTAELERLKGLAEKAWSGEGQAVSLIGEAGLGKTRLIKEFSLYLRDRGFTVLQGSCPPEHLGGPYALFRELLDHWLDLGHGEPDEALLAALKEKVGEEADLVADLFSSLRAEEFFGGEERKERLQGCLVRLFVNQARLRPLALILDDLHWADELSIEVVERFSGALTGVPLLLLIVFRPEITFPCKGKGFIEIKLKPLSGEEGGWLVGYLSRALEIAPEDRLRITNQAGGNPFYIEEMIQAALETSVEGMVATLIGKSREPKGEGGIPGAIRQMIMARLDRLSPEDRLALQRASIVGGEFEEDILARLGEEGALPPLSPLKERGFIDSLGPGRWTFHHALIREVVYQGTLLRQRKAYHKKAGEAIESLRKESLDVHLPSLAHHFLMADEKVKGLRYVLQAGQQALKLYANREAKDYFERALQLSQELKDSVSTVSALEGLGDLHVLFGEYPQALDRFQEALKDIGQEGKLRASLRCKVGEVHLRRGEYPLADEAFRVALSEGGEGDLELRSHLFYSMATVCFRRGESKACSEYCQKGLDALGTKGSPGERAKFLNLLGGLHYQQGKFAEAVSFYEQSLRWNETSGEKRLAAGNDNNIGLAYFNLGNYPIAEKHFRKALSFFAEIGDLPYMAAVYPNLGMVLERQGDGESAESHYLKGKELACLIGDPLGEMNCLGNMARLCKDRGELGKARMFFEDALALARQIGNKAAARGVLTDLGVLCVQMSDNQAGLVHLQEARVLAEDVGSALGKMQVNFAFGSAFRLLGDLRLARENIEQALTLSQGEHLVDNSLDCLREYHEILMEQGDTSRAEEIAKEMLSLQKKPPSKAHP